MKRSLNKEYTLRFQTSSGTLGGAALAREDHLPTRDNIMPGPNVSIILKVPLLIIHYYVKRG